MGKKTRKLKSKYTKNNEVSDQKDDDKHCDKKSLCGIRLSLLASGGAIILGLYLNNAMNNSDVSKNEKLIPQDDTEKRFSIPHLEYASSLPEKNCNSYLNKIFLEKGSFDKNIGSIRRDLEDKESPLAEIYATLAENKDSINSVDQAMINICAFSDLEIFAGGEVGEQTKNAGFGGMYLPDEHQLYLASGRDKDTIVHEMTHCAQSIMNLAYEGQRLKNGMATPSGYYPSSNFRNSKERIKFENAFKAFDTRLVSSAKEIEKGDISDFTKSLLKVYDDAYPLEKKYDSLSIVPVKLPSEINANDSKFTKFAGKDSEGEYQPFDLTLLPESQRDLNVYKVKGGMKEQRFNLCRIDKSNNTLFFKPMDKELRFFHEYVQFRTNLLSFYTHENMIARRPNMSLGVADGVVSAERYANTMSTFGDPKLIDKLVPELLDFTRQTQKSFVNKVCSEGYQSREVTFV